MVCNHDVNTLDNDNDCRCCSKTVCNDKVEPPASLLSACKHGMQLDLPALGARESWDKELKQGLRIANSVQHEGCQGARLGTQESSSAGCTGNGALKVAYASQGYKNVTSASHSAWCRKHHTQLTCVWRQAWATSPMSPSSLYISRSLARLVPVATTLAHCCINAPKADKTIGWPNE